ncbi:hypothetical protein OS189_10395 [Sulfitobacter sp. F26169L]|uniref:hypothetical protein n=1 Tax=Sulfitobacter sp. F26169L TaxID=2996015 RepID=UPI0022609CF3|nr:hypothetical protein [Sulfitobacter sp. F26169L]MCX7566750.1 hypothetical protein [Sulfitobacter sp. F26169L]
MDVFLPKGFAAGNSRPATSHPSRARKLCVDAGGVYYPVHRNWATGFATAVEDTPVLSGVVDLYDGADHLHQCLITGHEIVDDEQVFTVKRAISVDYSAESDL